MASIDARYYGPLDAADAVDAVEALRAGEQVPQTKALAARQTAGGPEPEPDPRVAAVEAKPVGPGRGAEGTSGP